jgi:hypothetical protein
MFRTVELDESVFFFVISFAADFFVDGIAEFFPLLEGGFAA